MLRYILIALAVLAAIVITVMQIQAPQESQFEVVSEFEVDGNAEIIQAAGGGDYLVHTNSDRETIDVIDIRDLANPQRIASLAMPGEPTSVGVSADGQWAMAAVYPNESEDGEAPTDPRLPGILALIDLRDPAAAAVTSIIGIGHHPDSVAVTASGNELLAIIAIENEPVIVEAGLVVDDETPGDPNDISLKGSIQIVAINPEQPNRYSVTTIELTDELLRNSLMLFVDDPQPEYVAISPGKHMAAVSLQENNGIVLVDPVAGEILDSFNLGRTIDRPADLINDDKVRLEQAYPTDADAEPLAGTRFPDAIGFTPDGQYLLSADEGELALTGGRGFSIWSLDGQFVWDDGGEIEAKAAELGLYPDARSDIRGIEVEGVVAGRFGNRDYAFAISERGNFVAIYDISNPLAPVFVEILPVGTGPESAAVITERNLLVVASEKSGSISIIEHVAADAPLLPAAEPEPQAEPTDTAEPTADSIPE